MNLNLRQAIVQKVQGKSSDELLDVIAGSIGGDDLALPGLGVLFEIIWQNTDDSIHQNLVHTLQDHLPSSQG